jgi:ribosomal protein S18 acetylase RimI-like enzyme
MSTLQVRWMDRSDTEDVTSIRSDCGMSKDLLKVLSCPKYIIKVAELDGSVVGYLSYQNCRGRTKINEVGVSKDFRRMGVASDLLNSLISKTDLESKSVEALVPEYSLATQLLLKKMGFVATDIKGSKYKFVLKCQKESC